MLDPCISDTAASEYSLLESSPYIDVGHGPVFGGFNGLGPDLGGIESPYTSSEKCFFYPEEYIIDDFPAVTLGDTAEYTIHLWNIGPSPADSLHFEVSPPFYFFEISDSSCPVHESISLTFGYLFNYELDSLNSTAYMKWFSGDTSGNIRFNLQGYEIPIVVGAVSGTLSIDYSPYSMFNAVVPCGESLYIEPGVSLTGNLLVNGYLEAIGTLSDSILIYDGSITIESDSLCSQANAYIDYFFLDAARIQCNDSARVTLKHGLMANIRDVLTTNNGTELVVDSCDIGHIILNRGCVVSFVNSNVELKNSIFNGTTSMCREEEDGYGGHYYFISPLFRSVNNNITIYRCVFSNNWGVTTYDWGCDQVAMFSVYGSISFNNCFFIDNHADWTSMYSFSFPAFIINTGDTALFNNCIFVQSYGVGSDDNQIMNKGGAILVSNCNFRFTGIQTESGNSDVLNSVFYVSPTIAGDNYLYNCLVPPGTSVSDSSSVIFGTPSFVSDTSYQLLPTSIGVDMGAEYAVTDSGDTIWAPLTDYYGNPRPSGAGFDIGVAEYQWDSYTPELDCYPGWNLVSNPVEGTHFMTELLDSVDSPLFGYNTGSGNYFFETIMRQGKGYWVLITDTVSTEISDALLDSVEIDIHRGWNLVGSMGYPFDISSTTLDWLVPPIYGYDAQSGNYFATGVLLPGRGYWLLSESDTTLTIHR